MSKDNTIAHLIVQITPDTDVGVKQFIEALKKGPITVDFDGVKVPGEFVMTEEEFQQLAQDSKPAWDAALQKMNEEERKLRPITDEEYEAALKLVPPTKN